MTTQARVLLAISAHLATHGYAPTNREIGAAVGTQSTGHIAYHLDALEDAGLITRQVNKPRTLRLTAAGERMVAEMTREERVA